jgi:prepilin-type N-terminal cleavage/methylation domain-containing protein
MKIRIPRGFTLIELMVVIAIIIVLSSASLAAYFQFSQQQAAQNDARSLETILRRVQAMAKNLVYPVGCTSGLLGYRVYSNDCSGEGCQLISAEPLCPGSSAKVIDGEKIFTEAYFSGAVDVTFLAGTGRIESPITFPISNIKNIEVKADENGNISIK